MRAKKAKLLRRIARDAAIAGGLQEETQYDAANTEVTDIHHGTIRVTHCDRACLKQMKQFAGAKHLPLSLIDTIGIRAISIK